MRKRLLLCCLIAMSQLTCHQAILTAPTDSTIKIFANPTFIPAHGGVSVISALVVEPAGTVVPDGTVVQFFTTLGAIDEQGKTNDGVARVNLVSDSRSGEAEVSAFSGIVAAEPAKVTIGNGVAKTLFMEADPQRILPPARTSTIVANVLDALGNPVPNSPIYFRIEIDVSGKETLDVPTGPVFTDNSGRARNTLRTSAAFTDNTRKVRVFARSPSVEENYIEVVIN